MMHDRNHEDASEVGAAGAEAERKPWQTPVAVEGICLRGDGIGDRADLVVEVKVDGQYYEAIRESAANPDTISHCVSASGIRGAASRADALHRAAEYPRHHYTEP